jgi:hypothetical protein
MVEKLRNNFRWMIRGWVGLKWKLVFTLAFTCFLSPGRGQASGWLKLLCADRANTVDSELKAERTMILLLLGEKAGMRASAG